MADSDEPNYIHAGPRVSGWALVGTALLLKQMTGRNPELIGNPPLAGPNEFLQLVLDSISLADIAKAFVLGAIAGAGRLAAEKSIVATWNAAHALLASAKRFELSDTKEEQAQLASGQLDQIRLMIINQQQVGQFLISVGSAALNVPDLQHLDEEAGRIVVANAFAAANSLSKELKRLADSGKIISTSLPPGEALMNENLTPAVELDADGNASVTVIVEEAKIGVLSWSAQVNEFKLVLNLEQPLHQIWLEMSNHQPPK